MTATYQVQQGQSIYDICLQVYLTLDKLSKLIDDNDLASIYNNPDLMIGLFLKYDSTLTANSSVFNAHQNKSIIYATAKSNIFVTLDGASFNDDFDDSFDEE